MRRPALLALFVVLALPVLSASARAQSPSPTAGSVVVVKVDGSIDATQARYLRESLDRAEAEGATAVIQLDSAGTLDQDAVGLAERIHDARVPVIVWVGPAPAKARGAGLLFMYAASLAAVAPRRGRAPSRSISWTPAARRSRAARARGPRHRLAEERGRPTPLAFPAEPVPARRARRRIARWPRCR
jgi:membrane-bound ClpP family serine protease